MDKQVVGIPQTYDIPLYVNREAGEITPNITERYRSKGQSFLQETGKCRHRVWYGFGNKLVLVLNTRTMT